MYIFFSICVEVCL